MSGKTTTLEALITRSGLRALTFVTKRGEGSFTSAREIQPYFRDYGGGRPYWEFVESIVASTMGQKMKFERAWIAKAAKGARSLRNVRENLDRLQNSSRRSMDQDIYMLLGEYLDIVLPQMERLPPSAPLHLQPGLNVMDLTAFTEEMQMLIVRSSILWVHEQEKNVVTIMPEAWKFIPEGRLTPVKPAAERLIREGAGLGNFVWMDSQDIAGVSKLMLRAATVWIIGVQREANEIKRTLSNIPAVMKKPKAEGIATLNRGEFFACFDKEVRRVYVQPTWLSEPNARRVALGEVKAEDLAQGLGSLVGLAKQVRGGILRKAPLTASHEGYPEAVIPLPLGKTIPVAIATVEKQEKKVMAYDEDKARLERENLELKHTIEKLQHELEELRTARPTTAVAPARAFSPEQTFDNEAMYQAIKKRLIAEAPGLIRLLSTKPEIEVTVERKTVQLDGSSLKGRLARLLSKDFFTEAKTQADTYRGLTRTGPDVNRGNLSRAMSDFVKDGFLTDEGSAGFREVEGMKVNIVEAA